MPTPTLTKNNVPAMAWASAWVEHSEKAENTSEHSARGMVLKSVGPFVGAITAGMARDQRLYGLIAKRDTKVTTDGTMPLIEFRSLVLDNIFQVAITVVVRMGEVISGLTIQPECTITEAYVDLVVEYGGVTITLRFCRRPY